jgi:hypothetical protein
MRLLDRYTAAGGAFRDTANNYAVWVPGRGARRRATRTHSTALAPLSRTASSACADALRRLQAWASRGGRGRRSVSQSRSLSAVFHALPQRRAGRTSLIRGPDHLNLRSDPRNARR